MSAAAPSPGLRLAILPSARLVPPELQTDFGPIPHALLPLDGRPALSYVAEPYVAAGYDVLVAVGEQGEQVRGYLERHAIETIRAVDVGPTRSLGETVLGALDAVQGPVDHLIVNFADTCIDDLPAGRDAVFYAEPGDLYRWTTFAADQEGRITRVVEKWRDKPGERAFRAFVGVFAFRDAAAFAARLRAAIAAPPGDVDPFYAALAAWVNDRPAPRGVLAEARGWRDFGHLDTYCEVKRRSFLNARHFNELSLDGRRGVIRKTSRDPDTLIREIRWYLSLPRPLQHLAPRVLDYDLSPTGPYLECEYYGYPALNDLYLFANHDLGLWSRVLGAIDDAIRSMQAHRLEGSDREALTAAMRRMYEHKTADRLRPVLSSPRFEWARGDAVTINGRRCPGLPRVLASLAEVAGRAGLYQQDFFTVVHGDLCLSNILFDRRNSFVRLVDPRGSFGPCDVHGDPRYDVAKLRHSFLGDYDFFANGVFRLRRRGDAIEYEALLEPRHERIKTLFRAWLDERWAESLVPIRLIESLLFLSMVPLHRGRCQEAMLARGLDLFAGVSAFVGATVAEPCPA